MLRKLAHAVMEAEESDNKPPTSWSPEMLVAQSKCKGLSRDTDGRSLGLRQRA